MLILFDSKYVLASDQEVDLGLVSQGSKVGLSALKTFVNQNLAQGFAVMTYFEIKGLSRLLGPFRL